MLSKFTNFLKLVVKLKSFKILTKLNEIQGPGVFSNSAEAPGVVIVASARLELRFSSFQVYLQPF